MLKQYARLTAQEDFSSAVLFFSVFYLISAAVTALIVAVKQFRSVVLLSSALLLLTGAILLLAVSVGVVNTLHDIHLSFSCTRKNSLRCLTVSLGLLWALSTGLCLLFRGLDHLVLSRILTALAGQHSFGIVPMLEETEGIRIAQDMLLLEVLPYWWITPLVFLGAILVGFVCGTLVRRFGARAGWALYLLFMAGLLTFNRTDSFFMSCLPWLIPALLLLLAAGLAWSVRELLRSPIHP